MTYDGDWRDTFRPDIPSVARIYDYLLGGSGSFSIDRAVAHEIGALIGHRAVRDTALENRAYHGRVVDYLVRECGIDQFLEVGPGLPSPHSTHEVTRRRKARFHCTASRTFGSCAIIDSPMARSAG